MVSFLINLPREAGSRDQFPEFPASETCVSGPAGLHFRPSLTGLQMVSRSCAGDRGSVSHLKGGVYVCPHSVCLVESLALAWAA